MDMEFKQITEQQAKFIKQINNMKLSEVRIIAMMAQQKDGELWGTTARELSQKLCGGRENYSRMYSAMYSLNDMGIIKLEHYERGIGQKAYFNIKLRKDWVEYIASLYKEE